MKRPMNEDNMQFTRSDFPDDFLFGTATSSYQIEGHAFGGAGATHWDSFAATPGNVAKAENGATACDHYHRWAADLDLMLDGALEHINEAAFDTHDMALFEGDDPVTVNAEILEKVEA